jgi:hypothetical protein
VGHCGRRLRYEWGLEVRKRIVEDKKKAKYHGCYDLLS